MREAPTADSEEGATSDGVEDHPAARPVVVGGNEAALEDDRGCIGVQYLERSAGVRSLVDP